ncbi:unnamed protein product [Rhizophagus irregularis]|nr:unnamed protein product [Rhizophagus irregularis]
MSKLSKGTADINDALNNNNSLINIISNISNIDHLELKNCSSGTFNRSSISYNINESELHNHLDIMEFKDTSLIASDKMLESSTDLIESISCNANKIIADELIGYINEKHDRGIAFDQEAVENDNKVALYKLGECYEVGKGVIKNEARALDYYKQATLKGYVVDIEKVYKGDNSDAKNFALLVKELEIF